jgi:hypothetical protein
MRDFEKLEELSSTVRSGLEASAVVWAIDQALAGAELDDESIAALESGHDMLETIADPASAPEEPDSPLAQNMLGGDSVPTFRSMIGLSEEDNPRELAQALKLAGERKPLAEVEAELERALEVFADISAIRLGQAGGISRSGRERLPWLPEMTTSPSS